MKKTFWTVVGVIFVVLIVSLVINNKTPDKVVKIGYAPNIGYLPLHIAVEQKLFEEEGVRVELVQLQSAQQLYEALVRKEVDYVPFLSTVVILNGEAVSGGNVRVSTVSDISLDNPFDGLLVKKDSEILTLKDLQDKKIGVFPGTTGMNFMKQYLQGKGIDVATIEFVQLAPPSQLPSLESGAIDAMFAYEPSVTLGVEKFGFRKLVDESVFASQINHAAFGSYVFSTAFSNEYPKLADKIVRAMDKGNAVISNDPSKARSIAKKIYNLDDAVAQKVSMVKMIPSTEFKQDMFGQFADFLVKIGELKAATNLSLLF